MREWYRGNAALHAKMDALLQDFYGTFGWKTRVLAPLFGRYALAKLKGEEKRLKEGWRYEPRTLREMNAAALALRNRGPGRFTIAIPEVTLPIPRPAPMRGAQ